MIDYAGRQSLFSRTGAKRALHGIDLQVRPREVVAVVGGSGSGKTTLGRAIAGLLAPSSGQILFRGAAVDRRAASWRDYRLNCQMVFQDPYSSLDPRMTIGELVGEGLRMLGGLSAQDKRRRVDEVLAEVGLGSEYAGRYPHELSGGQRQRVAIARAVVRPAFVIADEPVSALDVTVRAQVLDLFADLQARHGFSCLFISHDLGVVEQVADRVVVMRDGAIVEQGARDEVFDRPCEDYTRKLLSAIPALESTRRAGAPALAAGRTGGGPGLTGKRDRCPAGSVHKIRALDLILGSGPCRKRRRRSRAWSTVSPTTSSRACMGRRLAETDRSAGALRLHAPGSAPGAGPAHGQAPDRAHPEPGYHVYAMDPDVHGQIRDIRILLETGAAADLMPNVTSARCARCALAERFAKLLQDGTLLEQYEVNLAFHAALYDLCSNRELVR